MANIFLFSGRLFLRPGSIVKMLVFYFSHNVQQLLLQNAWPCKRIYYNTNNGATKRPLNLNFYRGIKMTKLEILIQNFVMIGLAALMLYPILGVTYLMIKAA
jgi:hypothetical protein